MPDGQLKQLTPDDVRDLVAYLASPGQVPLPGEGPWFDPGKGKSGRRAGRRGTEDRLQIGRNPRPQALRVLRRAAGAAARTCGGPAPRSATSSCWTCPSRKSGHYEVFVALTKAIDYGIVRLTWNDAHRYAHRPVPRRRLNTPPISLGQYTLQPGKQRLTIEIIGANPAAVKSTCSVWTMWSCCGMRSRSKIIDLVLDQNDRTIL